MKLLIVFGKRFIPKHITFSLPEAETPKKAFKKIHEKCLFIGKEMWYPDPYKSVVVRNKLMHYCTKLRYYYKSPECECEQFRLYIRLNPTYDLTSKNVSSEDPKIVEVVDIIWRNFGEQEDDGEELKSAEDVIKNSNVIMLDYEILSTVFLLSKVTSL